MNSVVVSALSAVGLAVTLILYRVVTQRYGPTDTDAFFLAFGFLNLVIGPAYNAISSTLVPTIVRHRSASKSEIPILLGAAVGWAACGSLVAIFLLSAFAVDGLQLFGGAVSGTTARLVRTDVMILAPLATMQSTGAVLAAASQAAGRYWAPAAAAVLQQCLTAAFVVIGLPVSDAVLLPLAFTLGTLGYLVFLLAAWPWREMPIRLSLTVPGALVTSARLAVPLVWGTFALQAGLMGLRLFAARLEPGAITAFDLAYRVSFAIVEVSAGGALAVTLTNWSAAVALGQTESLRSRLGDTLSLVLFVTLPLPVILHALRQPVVQVWLSSRTGDATLGMMTVAALGVLLIGVPFEIAGRLYGRALLAQRRTAVLGWLSLQRMIITLIVASLLVGPLAIQGVTMAEVIAIISTLLGLHLVVTRRWAWADLRLDGSWARIAITGVMSWATASVLISWLTGFSPWVQCAVGVFAALIAYVIAARVLRLSELSTVMHLFRPSSARPRHPEVIPDSVPPK